MHSLRVALAGGLLSACATVSQKPSPVEAPLSRSTQIAAQSAAQAAVVHRYKTKIAIDVSSQFLGDPKTNNRPFYVRVVEVPSTPLPSDPPW
jgi:hypothetical protein